MQPFTPTFRPAQAAAESKQGETLQGLEMTRQALDQATSRLQLLEHDLVAERATKTALDE